MNKRTKFYLLSALIGLPFLLLSFISDPELSPLYFFAPIKFIIDQEGLKILLTFITPVFLTIAILDATITRLLPRKKNILATSNSELQILAEKKKFFRIAFFAPLIIFGLSIFVHLYLYLTIGIFLIHLAICNAYLIYSKKYKAMASFWLGSFSIVFVLFLVYSALFAWSMSQW